MRLLIMLSIAALSACGKPPPPSLPKEVETSRKIEGPPVSTLSHAQLETALHECLQYGKTDDARVKYTQTYCSSVMSAHLSEDYAKPAKPDVDPSINRLH